MTSTVVPSSNVTASSSSSSTSINTPSLTNNNEIDAKNLLRIIHNQSLQACHDVGESGIPTDESLVPCIPEPPTPQTGSSAHQWVSAYSLLSPTSKIQAVKALDTLKPTKIKSIPSLPKVIFTADREVKVSSSTDGAYSLGIHAVVTELAKAKQYTHLTLFTIANTFRLHKEGHLLKKTKSSIDGTIYHLLDLSQFEAEEAMDALTWQEAWQCKISWLAEVAEPAVHEHWSWHFSTLLKDEAIRNNFKAILSFDIRMRSRYTAQPFQHDERDWQARLQAAKYDVVKEELRKLSSREDRHSTARYEPYDASARKNTKHPWDGQESFQDGASSSDTRVKSDPMCLICQRSGHRFSECKEETTAKGKQTYAKYAGGHLIRRSNGSTLCIAHNLANSKTVCKNSHAPSQHLCSFCGEAAHGALSHLCV
ncbi:hypothetical protein PAXINDRAFT_9477 [Paxillus involutus ATCC 200175]|nr:hypothetical protein PAXINDRAFT_9477 [Paxillus involutus ATCC 200175]